MTTARELLEQADALMRRNRAQVRLPDVPTLVDAVPPAGRALADTDAPVDDLDDVPLLTDAVEEIEAPSLMDPPPDEGEASLILVDDEAEVEEFTDADLRLLDPSPEPETGLGHGDAETPQKSGGTSSWREAPMRTLAGDALIRDIPDVSTDEMRAIRAHVATQVVDTPVAPTVDASIDDVPPSLESIAAQAPADETQAGDDLEANEHATHEIHAILEASDEIAVPAHEPDEAEATAYASAAIAATLQPADLPEATAPPPHEAQAIVHATEERGARAPDDAVGPDSSPPDLEAIEDETGQDVGLGAMSEHARAPLVRDESPASDLPSAPAVAAEAVSGDGESETVAESADQGQFAVSEAFENEAHPRAFADEASSERTGSLDAPGAGVHQTDSAVQPEGAQPSADDEQAAQARWNALAEEIRMQVLQRIDLFTDTGLRVQLAARLQPIVDRASADLVATINQHVGMLLRSYVAEAIEREIEKWREGDRKL